MKLLPYLNKVSIDHPWMNSMPSSWSTKRLKFMANIQNGRDYKDVEADSGGYPVIGSGGEFKRAHAYLYKGQSVLLGRKGTIDKPLFIDGAFWTVDTMYYTVISKKFSAKFLYYCALTIPFNRFSTSTALPSMTQEDLGGIAFTVPETREQKAIATFLDRETARIDTLIEKQQRLIALLKEKRQAVISHAVTKGLDPTVPMKGSGVEWLGEVPEHWGICALGYASTIDTGSTPDRNRIEYWNGDIPWIKTGEVNYEPIWDSEEKISQLGLAMSSTRLAPPGTILMAMYGQGVTRGRVAILEIAATYNQACSAISLSQRLNRFYTRYFFMAAYTFVRDAGNETSQMNLSAGIIGKMKILLPLLAEQEGIVKFLDIKVKQLDKFFKKAEKTVSLLQERRTALISAAVTGKIDVSNHPSAQQPAEATELEVA